MSTKAAIQHILQHADAVCFDVDSTVVQCEAIDELAKYCNKAQEVAALTTKAMAGDMAFQDSLQLRLDIIRPSHADIKSFLQERPPQLTPNITNLITILNNRKVPVYLISGGFRCIIQPIATVLNISLSNIYANRLLFYYDGTYAGFDRDQPTSKSGGKAVVCEHLKKQYGYKNLVLIGDGITDFEACPPADAFIGFGGNIVRQNVLEKSAWFVHSFQEIIDVLNVRCEKC